MRPNDIRTEYFAVNNAKKTPQTHLRRLMLAGAYSPHFMYHLLLVLRLLHSTKVRAKARIDHIPQSPI